MVDWLIIQIQLAGVMSELRLQYIMAHWDLNKMDTFLQMTFLNENDCISIQILLKFVPRVSVDNKSALVQVMVRCQTGDMDADTTSQCDH